MTATTNPAYRPAIGCGWWIVTNRPRHRGCRQCYALRPVKPSGVR
jgi:hypothetical protein